jgi:hypothetical protein
MTKGYMSETPFSSRVYMILVCEPITSSILHHLSVYFDMYFVCIYPFEQCLGPITQA